MVLKGLSKPPKTEPTSTVYPASFRSGSTPHYRRSTQTIKDASGDKTIINYTSTDEPSPAKRNKGAKVEIWNQKNKYGWTPLMIAEGHRPGNFKPSAETIAALHRVMLAAGVSPPTNTTPVAAASGDAYPAKQAKKSGP